jgi:hypothetical protein
MRGSIWQAGLDAGEIEDVVQDLQKTFGGGAYRVQVVALFGGQLGVERERGETETVEPRQSAEGGEP